MAEQESEQWCETNLPALGGRIKKNNLAHVQSLLRNNILIQA